MKPDGARRSRPAPDELAARLSVLPDARLLRAEKARRGLHEYVRWAWPLVDPAEFIDNWHVGAMCEHLEGVTRGQIQKLVMNVPPRHQKSLTTCVFWPTWEWIDHPEEQYIYTSHRQDLAIRDAVKSRRLLERDEYRAAWGDRFALAGDANLKHRYENTRGGHRISVGFGSALGENATRVVADDPHNWEEINSKAVREGDLETWDQTLAMRRNNPKRDALVIIMQRLHHVDLVGHVLKQGGWTVLKIPAEWDGGRVISLGASNLGTKDPRTKRGELICDKRIGPAQITEMKVALGTMGAASQLQQEPTPAEGGIFKRPWFRLWPADHPIGMVHHLVLIYDTAFTKDQTNDPSACVCFAIVREPPNDRAPLSPRKKVALLFDAWDEHLSVPELRRRVADDWRALYGADKATLTPGRRPDACVIEAKASGIGLIQDLNEEAIPAIAAKRIYGTRYELDKVARAHNVTHLAEAGLVWVLQSKHRPGKPRDWAEKVILQLMELPGAEHDDLADAFVHGLTYLVATNWLEVPLLTAPRMPDEQKRAVAEYAQQKRAARANPYAT